MPDYPIIENIKPTNSGIPVQSTDPARYIPSSFSHPSPPKKSIDDFFPASTKSNSLPLTVTSGELQSDRFPIYDPSKGENEFAYAQGWGEKMVNGIGKGLSLTGTTFLQSTIGLLNGVGQAAHDGRLASFYDNEFNRSLDKFNKELEDSLPNYYTDAEKEAHWYSPTKLLSANFVWDGIVKNLGFSAGAALAGGVYGLGIRGATSILSKIPQLAKLVSIGKSAEALAATETELLGTEKIAESASKIVEASNRFLGGYNVLNRAQRITVAGLATTGEASFEALNNMNQYRDEKIAEYIEKNGKPPIGIDLEKINKASEEVGDYSLGLNVALLSVTNYIQFPKILGSSYKAEKGVINDVVQKTKNIVREGEKYSEKIVKGGIVIRNLNKVRPYLFSASEGFEEGAQYAITVGTQDYFDKKRLNKNTDVMESVVEGIGKTLSTDEGMENVLIGGLSGSIMLGVGKFKEARNLSKNTKEALDNFNKSKLSDFTRETEDSVNRGVIIQEEREQTLKEGNITDSKDLEKDYIINYLIPRIKFGRYDLVTSDIEDYKRLASTEEGWQQLISEGKAQSTDNKEAYIKRLNNFEQTAKNMKSLYQSLHIRYGGIADENGKPKYSSDVIDKMVYAITKISDYDERIASLIPIITHQELLSSGVDISTIIKDLSKGNYESFDKAKELISSMDDTTKDDILEALFSIRKMAPRREKFRKEYEDMKNSPQKWTEKEVKVPTEEDIKKGPDEEAEYVELDTVKGKTKATVGETYFLGSIVNYDESGLEKPVEISEFKILKNNGDSIDVLTDKGEVKTVSKDVFKKYNIGSLSAIEKDDNANYFYQHRNEKFEFNFGKDKDGNPIKKPGRIEYKDGKLFFVYTKYIDKKTGKPVLRHIEVGREQFFAKGEFNQPMIKKIGAIETKEQATARERLTDEKKRKEENKRLEESARKRNDLLSELFNDLAKQNTDIKNQIEKAKARLNNIITTIAELTKKIESSEALDKRIKNELRFKKSARKYITIANTLLNEKEELENTIANLIKGQENIELSIAYVRDISQYDYEMSPDIEEFVKQIEEQLSLLEETRKENNNQINILQKFLSGLEKTIDKIFEALRSLISEFEEKYPKVPNAVLGREWVDFLQANPNFLKAKPNYKEDLKSLEDIISETEEFEITPKEKYAEAIKDEINSLQKELEDLDSQTQALTTVLNKFKPYAEKAKQQRIEEEKLTKDSNVAQSIEKTMSNKSGIRNADLQYDKEYEPEKKKNDKHVISSTITTDDGKVHQKRSNLFGTRFPKFKNRNKIRGVYITSKNENLLIPGLTGFLFPKTGEETEEQAKEKQASIIALVMTEVDEKTGKISLIGVDGNPLVEGLDPLENAIFQVFPETKLSWSDDGESMFRKTTPKEVQDTLRKEYSSWREGVLRKTGELKTKEDLIEVAYKVNASFGIPTYVRKDDNSIDYSVHTSVEDAKLADENDIKNRVVLTIPTTNDIYENGSTKFTKALGRVFISLVSIDGNESGATKLQNRQLNTKEATVVYKVFHRLSKLAMKKKGLETEEAKRLFDYLRSVVYYRVSQSDKIEHFGRNNVFVKRDPTTDELTLYISDDGTKYTFKPSSLEENKKAVIESLESLFMNINNNIIKDINETYEEITDVNDDGEVVSNLWENYQTYLLSNTDHKGSARNNEDIPLFTLMKPVISDDETNRHGIYFYVEDDGETPIVPDYTSKKKSTISFKSKKEELPEEKGNRNEEESRKLASQKVKKAIFDDIIAKKSSPKLDDKESFTLGELENDLEYVLNFDRKNSKGTINTFTTKEGRKIRFYAEPNVDGENYLNTISIIADEQFNEIVEIYINGGKETKEEVKENEPKKPLKANKIEEDQSFTLDDLDEEADNIFNDILGEERLNDEDEELTRQMREGEINDVEDWEKVQLWLKENYPNIPIYRLQNIINTSKGYKAWGMLKKGAIYIFKNAEGGTIYHEVFESIWKSFTSADEKVSLFNEFKRRKGIFYDIGSGKDIKYSDATINQAKERMADELREYIHEKKIPPKPESGKPFILKLFYDVVNFFKSFFVTPGAESRLEELFSKINKGYYKDFIAGDSELTFAKKGIIDVEDEFGSEDAEYSVIKLSDRERADVIEQMTYSILKKLIDNDESLFNIPNIKRSEVYPELKKDIFRRLDKMKTSNKVRYDNNEITKEEYREANRKVNRLAVNINTEWDSIIGKHDEYLRKYGVEFDENDYIQLNDGEKAREDPHGDARKTDSFRKANAAIKILLATLPKTTINEGKVEAIRTSINGVSLIPVSQTVISLWNKLANAVNIDDMMDKLSHMAKDDPNYRILYKRLTKEEFNSPSNHIFGKINTTHGSQLLSAFWNTFKKQNPSVQNIFVLDNGDVVTGEANLSTSSLQFRDSYKKNIILKAKEGKSFFIWNKKAKKFVGDPITIRGIVLDSPRSIVSFLNKLGIEFTLKELSYLKINHKRIYNQFEEAVGGIRSSIINAEEIASFSGKVLDIEKRLLQLGIAKSIATNPSFDSTFFNIVGERMQSYIGTNAASDLYDFLSNVSNKEELRGTQYEYLLTDSFAQGSNILKQMFDDNGDKRYSEGLLKVGYAGGIMYSKGGKNKESSKLTYMERLIQELNLNLQGWYLNLVPGDASIEWVIQMGSPISTTSLRRGMEDTHNIFREYFISELNLAREDRGNLSKSKKELGEDLRFFKDILPEKIYTEIMTQEGSSRDVYEKNKKDIDEAIDKYVERNTNKTRKVLDLLGIINEDEKGFTLKNVNLPSHMNEITLKNHLTALTINYMIANIELHKVLYSDPYQYSDELKRIKSFLSPRQSIISGSESVNKMLNRVWNKGFRKKDIGYTDFIRDYFRTTTLNDIKAFGNIPGYIEDTYDETDGSGIIKFSAYRNFRIRAKNWNDNEERQYKHDIEYEKLAKSGANSEQLVEFNKANPKVQSAYTPLKPIVSGNKANGKDYNDIVLDKYALYPLSYRMMMDININGGKTNSNAIVLYDKMQKEDLDYVIFNSGRKVGAEKTNDVYDAKGNFISSPYEGIINIPFSIMSLQTEVPAKEGNDVTRGSQATKLITMDFMEAGVPIDFMIDDNFEKRYSEWYSFKSDEEREKASPLFKEIKNNQAVLESLMDEGYDTLLKKLGIKEIVNKNNEKEYDFSNFSMAASTLRDEILKREINDNLIAAVNSFGKETSLLESTPAYQQVRNILYSIVDRLIVSPKMPGGQKVQIPSTFLENQKLGIKKIEGKKGYQSDTLKFYSKSEDGKKVNVCQMMVKRWFKSSMSDKELLDYLNTTDEGKKILRGIGFRIPTQKQNSIDVFEIAQFLPEEFGDAIVIPSELVRKAGSDFDIDKLSIYLKNVFEDVNGNIKQVPVGLTKTQIYEAYDRGDFLSPKQREKLENFIEKERGVGFRNVKGQPIISAENILLRGFFPEQFSDESLTRAFIDELTDKGLRELLVAKFYKESLENAYIESADALISHPLNYAQLTKPNSAKDLKSLAENIAKRVVGKAFDYEAVNNMLDRTFMSRLRHAFVTGKQAIAIAAVSQTNHSLNQRQLMVVNPSLISRVSDEDKSWLYNGEVKFSRFNRIKVGNRMLPTLSKIKNAAGEYISDIIAQFIDGYVDISKGPWIMELGAFPNVAPTFLFLVKIGVPIEDVAYFMNQPIIRSYLQELESNGYTWLFNSTIVETVKSNFASDDEITRAEKELNDFKIPSKYDLKELVGKSKFTKDEKIGQLKMLDEFLKYAKMATHLYNITQATNYDTATFNDPLLIWKKEMQMIKANQTLISDAQSLLNNSFVGHLPNVLKSSRNAIAKILISDQTKVRGVLQRVLTPYIDMNDRDFLKIAKKATADIFDYAVQTDGEFNKIISELFVGGAVSDIAKLVESVKADRQHPLHDNHIINILQISPSPKGTENSINNIKIKGTDNKIYDQNTIIYAFREIRDFLGKDSKIYKGLINVAILQSGLSPSTISYTSLIPFEDFEEVYGKTLSKLETIDLEPFVKYGVFYRNNWNNDDIVSHLSAFWVPTKKGKMYNISMKFFNNQPVLNAITNKEIPPLTTIPLSNKESNEDYIFYTWNLMDELLTKEDLEKIGTNNYKRLKRIFEIQEEMRKKGNFSYMRKALFQKVIDERTGTPLMTKNKEKYYVVYKAINAWGEGNRANEFYNEEHQSIIDNGLESVNFVENSELVRLFEQPNVKESKKRADGYMSPQADYDTYSKESPVDETINSEKTEDWQDEDNACQTPF